MEISINNLDFSYHKKQILKDISLSIKPKDFLGILGPNGCGKSTLMKNIIKLLEPTSGIITLNNKSLKDYTHKDLAKLLGFVPQKTTATMPLIVKDFLLNALYSQLQRPFFGYTQKEYAKIIDISKQVNITQFLDSSIFNLSGGEFQRVLLARAIISNPKVLFLDEPTSALDLNYAQEMLSICEGLIHSRGLSVVAILHDLNLASVFCKKIIFLKNGEVIHKGDIEDLYTEDILFEVYNLKCDVITFNNKKFVLPKKI